MELKNALLVYLVIVVLTFVLGVRFRISKWSSLVLSLLVGMIILSLIFPISSVERVAVNGPYLYIYTVLQILTVFILLWYILYSIFHDRDCILKVYAC